MSAMQTSANGRKLIEEFEGLRLTSYQDQRGIWTIGYGHTANVFANETITQAEADDFLAIDLHQVETVIYNDVKVPLNQNQFDALVSFIYNIGSGNFADSTLLQMLNLSNYSGAAEQFMKWIYTNGTVNPGLERRRAAEQALFLTPETI